MIDPFSVPEGIYELVYTNIGYDFDTGYPDTWDYKLIPYNGDCDD